MLCLVVSCDGPCLRSFHACLSQQEKEEGKDCITLGFTEKQFKVSLLQLLQPFACLLSAISGDGMRYVYVNVEIPFR